MNKLFRQVFYLVIMLINAGMGFAFVEYVNGRFFHSAYVTFELQAAIGLFAAMLVPAFIFNRSASVRDRLLTIAQFTILIVTGIFGVSAKFFIGKDLLLFLIWFACADIAMVTVFYMVERLWKVNGPTPTQSDLESWVWQLGHLQTIENVLEERIGRFKNFEGNAGVQYQHLDYTLHAVQNERRRWQQKLEPFGIGPAPVLGADRVEGEPGDVH